MVMNNLVVRILFGIPASVFFVFLLWHSNWSRWSILLFLGGVGAWEWSRMLSAKIPGTAPVILGPLATCAWILAWTANSGDMKLPMLFAPVILASYVAVGFSRVSVQELFPWLSGHMAAPLYLGLWGGLMISLIGMDLRSSLPFMLVVLSMWFCDTFAYLTGRLIGRHKLAPTISPKKTWEGAIGGTLATVILVWWLGSDWIGLHGAKAAFLGFVLAVTGQVGDLLMSVLKRYCGAKDSSHIFPGHGGILDRFDSLFMAGPTAAILLYFMRSLG